MATDTELKDALSDIVSLFYYDSWDKGIRFGFYESTDVTPYLNDTTVALIRECLEQGIECDEDDQ